MAEVSVKLGLKVGVPVKETTGVIAYIGSTTFASGKWIGVILDEPKGKNNGTVQGKTYFKCEEGYGAFLRATQLTILGEESGVSTTNSVSLTPAPERQKSRLPLGQMNKPTQFRTPGPSLSTGLPSTGLGLSSAESVTPLRPTPTTDFRPPNSEKNTKRSKSFVEPNFHETFTPKLKAGANTPQSLVSATPRTSIAGALRGTSLEEKANLAHKEQEIQNLKAEIEDLNEKVDTLKVKRSQDLERLKEGEKLRFQVEQLLEFKSKILESQASLQKDLDEARKQVLEARDERDSNIEENQEALDNVEMLTLDKEMAEEKAESLHIENEQLKEQLEEVRLDLEILRAELNENDNNINDNEISSVKYKQLEQQNDRLRDALVRLRNVSAQDKHVIQKLQKELETKEAELGELTRAKEKAFSRLNQMEETVADLREQVDASMGAVEMCETLTDRNLNLEDKVEELEKVITDLEAISDINDQMIETNREHELELRQDIDLLKADVAKAEQERDANTEIIVDREMTIGKFRQLVQKMQNDNFELCKQLEKETLKPMATPSEIIDFHKIFSDTKAHSKAVEMELRRLEVTQAKNHQKMLIQYLPDTFLNPGGDHEGVLLLLLLPRLLSKAEIIIGGLRDRYECPDTVDKNIVLKSHILDQYAFSCRVSQMLFSLQTFLSQYNFVLNSCDVDFFLKLGGMYSDFSAQEKNIDIYVNLLTKDKLDETTNTEFLEKALNYFTSAFANHFSDKKLDHNVLLLSATKALKLAANFVKIEARRYQALMEPNLSSEMAQFFSSLKITAEDLECFVQRIKIRMPQNDGTDGSTGPISYPKNIEDGLISVILSMLSASKCLKVLSTSIMQQSGLISDSVIQNGVPGSKILEFLHAATDQIYGKEDQGPPSLLNSVSEALKIVRKIAEAMEKGEYDFDGTHDKKSVPPMALRAESIKNELKNYDSLKYRLTSRDEDIRELKLLLKMKGEELSQMIVRRDMAEKKLDKLSKESDLSVEKLQRKLDDAMNALLRKEKEFEETMEQLNNDIEHLEYEKGALRDKLKNINKKTIFDSLTARQAAAAGSPLHSPSSPNKSLSSSISDGTHGPIKDSPMLLQYINGLKNELRARNSSRYNEQVLDMKRKLAALKPLKVITKRSEANSWEEIQKKLGNTHVEKNKIRQQQLTHKINILREKLAKIQKEITSLALGPGFVDPIYLKRRDMTLQQFYSLHDLQYNKLQDSAQIIKDEIGKLICEQTKGGLASSQFGTFPTTNLVKALEEKKYKKIGSVRIPSDSKNDSIPIILNRNQLHELHTSFF